MSDSDATSGEPWPFVRQVVASRPNWVASTAADSGHRVEPFPLRGTAEESLAKLASVLREHPRTTISEQSPTRLRAVATSLIFRFRDDLEFVSGGGYLDVLSASRVGHSDLGANARRVATIRAAYERA